MQIRVLFADDQIPYENKADNDRVRKTIVDELEDKIPNVDEAYREDYEWFQALLNHLSKIQGLEIIPARTYFAAEKLIRESDKFDVAVIDLSWTGDPNLESQQKRNAGLKLIKELSEQNRISTPYKPTIAFSQNFKDDFELVATMLENDALPIQKTYSEVGHRTLSAAIKLLARLKPLEDLNEELNKQVRERRADVIAAGKLFNRVLIACFVCFIAFFALVLVIGSEVPIHWLEF
jgi:hypothetical protein